MRENRNVSLCRNGESKYMCYLCSLNIPPNLVRMMRQLKLNAKSSDRTILEILVYFL